NATALGPRQMEGLGEYLGGQLLTITGEQQPLGTFRYSARGEVAVRVVAFAASIGVVKQRPIGPLEVEEHPQRFADPNIGKGLAAPVHEQCLGLGRNLMRDARADHVPPLYGRKLVAVGPVLGLMLDVEIEFADLEGFEGHGAVPIELHLDAIEVVLAAV